RQGAPRADEDARTGPGSLAAARRHSLGAMSVAWKPDGKLFLAVHLAPQKEARAVALEQGFNECTAGKPLHLGELLARGAAIVQPDLQGAPDTLLVPTGQREALGSMPVVEQPGTQVRVEVKLLLQAPLGMDGEGDGAALRVAVD